MTDGEHRLTYRELALDAECYAISLRARGVERGDRVLVSMKRSPAYIAAMLGVMKAGAAYVPIEARTPVARRGQIIDDSRPRVLLCDPDALESLRGDDQLRHLEIDVMAVPDAVDGAGPLPEVAEDDVACILYTSGSTGRPKGVVITHRNIDAYVEWAIERIGIGRTDRVLGTAPFYFDMSLFDIYGSLRAGATLCIATEKTLLFPARLLDLAERERVTVWKGVSSLLAYLAQVGALSPERLPTLRTVLFGGEPLPTRVLMRWMETFPAKEFYNAYGPTEATGVSMYYRVERCPADPTEKIPIGIACENVDLYLLDENHQPVPDGEVGEIALGGVCITRGYLNDPDRTQRSFIADPSRPDTSARIYLTGDFGRRRPDGNCEFLGRRDHQVKVMGYRLELTDIENALVSIAGVNAAGAVVTRAARGDADELVAYIEVGPGTDPAAVQARLKQKLPYYMVPRHVFGIEQLPRSDRGKLDRTELEAIHLRRWQP